MSSEVRVPALPESVADATVLAWHKAPGDSVKTGENLVDLETDKVVLEVPATMDGVLGPIQSPVGTVVTARTVLATIESAGLSAAAPSAAPRPGVSADTASGELTAVGPATAGEPPIAPAARRLVKELNLDAARIPGTGRDGRVQKADVIAYLDAQERAAPSRDPESVPRASSAPPPEPATVLPPPPSLSGEAGRPEQRVPMTRLRARVAERLVEAQQNAAMLTTFNEVNLSAVMELRSRYKAQFEKTHGVRLGFMSFFVKAAVEGLQRFPVINASVDGSDIIYHGYYDIGIAVSSPRGLVVPILRNCDQLSMADIEQGIVDFAQKSKDGSLSFEELTGGTFSITNGGVFGSLLSTPILNPPQSAILGMHKTQERPIVENGQVVIAPMMYLALTYDHRIIDGREAVQFLVTVKETLEDPARLLLRI
jgi:2-oxoglutarate dehydrogenase E2 component (dihydrolipoamide succinyltransferase)